jgi:ABC-type nitrate/sulfonate/bicarbonate transport system substrate-binding protein
MKQVTLRKSPGRSVKTQMRILLVVVFGAYVVHAAEAQTLRLRYGQAYSSAHTIFSLPVAVADQEGLFAREGLKVDIIVPIPGGSDKMIAALHDEWVDLTHVATPFLIRAALAGSDAVAIAAEFKNPVYSLIANSSINSFAELKGRF